MIHIEAALPTYIFGDISESCGGDRKITYRDIAPDVILDKSKDSGTKQIYTRIY